MKKKILTISACVLVFSLSFGFTVGAWGVTLPDEASQTSGTITTTEFYNADKTFVARSANTAGTGYVDIEPNGRWAVVSRTSAGVTGSALEYTLTNNNNYQSFASEQIIGLSDFYNIDAEKYDVFLRSQTIAVEVYHGGASWSSYAPTGLTIVPYYAKIDGSDLIADVAHSLNITQFQQTTYTSYARWHVNLTSTQAMAVSAGNIPNGYVLYGIGYRWTFSASFASTTRFYLGNLGYSTYFSSNAVTKAIEKMSDEVTAEIEELGEQVSSAIEDSKEEILHGWDPAPVAPDGSSDVSNYEGAEQELLGSQSESLAQVNSIFSGIGQHFTEFTYGFIFINGLFGMIVGNKWVSALISISLALGIIAFLLNISPSVVSRLHSKANRADQYKKSSKR